MIYKLNPSVSRKSGRGFTLIELLVVIAVIAVLLAILLPALKKVKKIARRVVCMTNVRSFGQAFHSYASENEDKVTKLYYFDTGKFWAQTLIDFYGADKLRLCPEAVRTADNPYRTNHQGLLKKWKPGAPDRAWAYINDDGDDAGIEYTGSYGTNGWVHSGASWGPESLHWGGRMSSGNSAVPLMLDCAWTAGYPLLRRADGGVPLTEAEMENWLFDMHLVSGEMNRFCFDRHDCLINTVFMDGSASSVEVAELWLLRWTRDFPTKTVTIEWD